MYSDMSMRTIALVSSKRKPASARASSVLPTPVGPRKTNEPIGRLGSDSPVLRRRMAFGHGGHRLVLSDDRLVQVLLEPDQLVDFALHQLGHRDPGPAAHHLGDVLLARPPP